MDDIEILSGAHTTSTRRTPASKHTVIDYRLRTTEKNGVRLPVVHLGFRLLRYRLSDLVSFVAKTLPLTRNPAPPAVV